MAPIAEAIFSHSLSMSECHVKFSSIYISSDFTGETCLIGTLSMESSIESDRVLNLYLEPININSVLIAFMVNLLVVRSLSAKYRPDRYRCDKSVKFGTELP